MNRQIIFRGKRLDNGEWVYGDLEYNSAKNIVRIHTYGNNSEYLMQHLVQPDAVGQFTELFDRTGKNIFEGDILQCPSVPNISLEVRYNTLQGAFCLVEHTHSEGALLGTCPLGEMLRHYPDMSVIGNRFDNPDLLNGK